MFSITMESKTTSKTIKFKSSDGEEFLVDEEAAKLCQTICHLIEDVYTTEAIPIFKVTGSILTKVIEYCKKHVQATEASKEESEKPETESKKLEEEKHVQAAEASKDESEKPEAESKKLEERKKSEEELEKWDTEFLDVDPEMHYELMMAANYLNVKGLLDLTIKKAADMINGKSTEEIREAFNIENDLSPEEEDEIRSQNKWAFHTTQITEDECEGLFKEEDDED